MPCILHIDTSTASCSVALSQDTQIIYADEDVRGEANHNVQLGVFVDQALSFADSHAIPLDAVAVSSGPGSYTGLRIGVSMAKGVAYGLGVPLIAVPTLKLLATPVLLYEEELPEEALLCPMVDARRMEVYSALYDRALTERRPVEADIVTSGTYLPFLEQGPVYFFGTGAEKCKPVLAAHPNARFVDGIIPLARHMAPLAEQAYHRGEFADTAYFEPYYLKDFVAGKQRDMLEETR